MVNDKFFKYELRDYQADIINELNVYLEDRKLNVVAPPGSGKTVLGLEIICRLNKKTVIFVPTLAIKEQWVKNFKTNFISDLKIDDDIYILTYQSLNEGINVLLVNRFKNQEVVLCFDEAHHLHNKWLKQINQFKDQINVIFTLSFTATPPYDLNLTDYNKYLNLCGEIDTEVEITSLIKAKAVCPHQDYIYLNNLLNYEEKEVNDYRYDVNLALTEIINDNLLNDVYDIIRNNILNNKEEIYEDVSVYYLLVNYLILCNYKFDKKLLNKWLKNFKPQKILWKDIEEIYNYIVFNLKIEKIKNVFLKYDLIEKNKVNLVLSEKISKKINNSINKLKSINDIVDFEYNLRHDSAAILILTDYIRNVDLIKLINHKIIRELSVISIFQKLYSKYNSVAVLSGSLVIVEAKFLYLFKDLKYKSFDKYVIFENINGAAISLVSELYNSGKIKILIGTRSLLGEGWDSKITNTLIIASFVESFISSNQIRGRALRFLDNKISHIWHLLSVPFNIDINNDDFELKRRFTSFYGLSDKRNILMNNIYRYNYFPKIIEASNTEKINKKTIDYAKKLDEIKNAWQNISDNNCVITKDLSIPKERIFKSKIRIKQATSIILMIFSVIMFFVFIFINNNTGNNGLLDATYSLVIIILFILLYFLIRSYLYIANPLNYLNKIMNSLKETLLETNIIKEVNFILNKNINKQETYYEIKINSKYVRDKMIFYNAIKEILLEVNNPRYVLIYYFIFIPIYANSISCPSIISKNRQVAQIFADNLKRFGSYKLVYTRSENGVKILNKIKRFKWLK